MIETLTPVIIHIGKYILASALLFVFYRLFLKKYSSYNESRWFLLSIAILSIVVSQFRIEVTNPDPLIVEVEPTAQTMQGVSANTNSPILNVGTTEQSSVSVLNPNTSEKVEKPVRWAFLYKMTEAVKDNPLKLLLCIYIIVLLVFAINLGIQYLRIVRLINKGSVSYINGLRVVEHKEISTPFSFGKTVFLPAVLNKDKRDIIIRHESSHILHKHYIDVLLQEMLASIFWFNPIQWIIGKELRGVHEFQADRSVLDQGCELYHYQTIILEEIMGNHYRLANGFNQSFTKKRFIQMKQINHVKLGNIRKLFTLPFIFALFAAFTFQPGKSQVVKVTKSVTTSVMDNGEWKSETVKTTSTYNNGELQGETVETTIGDYVPQEQNLSNSNNGHTDPSFLQLSYNQSIDSIQRMINNTLPIVRKLAARKEPSKDIKNMESLMECLGLKVNNMGIGYTDLSEETKNSFTQSDFKQLEDILIRMNDSISVLKDKKIDGLDSPYIMQPAMLYEDLLTCDFVNKLMPEMFNIMGKTMQNMMGGFVDGMMYMGDMDEERYGEGRIDEANGGPFGMMFDLLGQMMEQTLSPFVDGEGNISIPSDSLSSFVDDEGNISMSYNAQTPIVRNDTPTQATSDNQSSLTHIAYYDEDPKSRLAAVGKLTDQSSLTHVAYFDKDVSVRLAAVEKLTDQSSLTHVAYFDKSSKVRLAAVDKSSNISSLQHVIDFDDDPQVKKAAEKRKKSLSKQ